ncbi:hypothetical protein CK507_09055 [Pseudomonas sp. WN033]|nr:hypothetical protein CK507_09055 [Pseudomonas sp. WN033]
MLTTWIAYLAFALLLFLLLPMGRLPVGWRWAMLAAAFVLGALPLIDGLSLAGYLRAFTDDLAMTSLVALFAAALVRLGWLSSPARQHKLECCLLFALMGLFLYPAAMGLGMLDPYRLGYGPDGLLLAVAALTLLMLWRGNRLAVLMLTLATLGYALELKASGNYWDYLLDPFIVLFALWSLCRDLVLGVFRRFWPA